MSKILIDRAVVEQALAEPVEPKTAWANLPNAAHIDRILAHAKEHPDKWAEAQRAYLVAVLDAVRGEARDAARWAAARGEARGEVWAAAWGESWGVAWDAIAALIAWDDAGELFSQPIEAVKAMADEGECAAVLIYPAMLAMGDDK